MSAAAILIIISVICFVLAAIGFAVADFSLVAVGLAFFAASFLVQGGAQVG